MSAQSTGLSKEERSDSAPSKVPPGFLSQFDCIRTIAQTAAICGIGEPSLRAMIYRGEGPQVTRLSKRRIGIRDSHREFWLRTLEAAGA
jgi:hypothetical protein